MLRSASSSSRGRSNPHRAFELNDRSVLWPSLRLFLRHDSSPTLVLRQEQRERAQRDELECPSPPSFQRPFSLQAPVQSPLYQLHACLLGPRHPPHSPQP